VNLPAHRGNIGLVEQQTGRPSKKGPAEAGQGILARIIHDGMSSVLILCEI